MLQASNQDLGNLFTPVNVVALENLLMESNYNPGKTKYLVNGFKNGFDLGYRGNENVKMTSKNLKFTIGNQTILWNKVMKEVQENRYAGPFENIPYDCYIQSPIGLVPKDNGQKTRLIFHLSHPRNDGTSVNANTPDELAKVSYQDFDEAVKLCIKCLKRNGTCFIGKSDLSAAFRHICMAKKWWKFLIMKAMNPVDGKWYFFVDKCMPFGARISCAIFQAFSDALAHIVWYKTKMDNINYLDDFFFADILCSLCNKQIETFLEVCGTINFPVSLDKTFWATTKLTFLGLSIDTVRKLISIPQDKVSRALKMVQHMSKTKKTTLKQMQKLCGFLNFLCRCIVPGRAFTRRLYNATAGLTKPHHHLNVNSEIKMDLNMWEAFLTHQDIYNRPFFEYDCSLTPEVLNWYTDASSKLGCGGIHGTDWFIMEWEEEFLERFSPSINYLELYAVTISILLWIGNYRNKSIVLFCDNMSVVHMINNSSSNCKNCMVLIRILTLKALIFNVKIQARHIGTKLNVFADHLSRLNYKEFRKTARKRKITFNKKPENIPLELTPMDKLFL